MITEERLCIRVQKLLPFSFNDFSCFHFLLLTSNDGRKPQSVKGVARIFSEVRTIGHFTVMDGSEAEGDLVLIQTFFALLWKLFLKNNS